MQFWEKKMNCNKKSIYFLLFPSFSIKTWKWKVIFYENNEISRKSSKNLLFRWKGTFSVKWHIFLFSSLKKRWSLWDKMLILLKTLKNTSFIILSRKKVYCDNIQCFLFIFWWKQWNKQKIIKKLTFSVKKNFSREIALIPFFLN